MKGLFVHQLGPMFESVIMLSLKFRYATNSHLLSCTSPKECTVPDTRIPALRDI